jgi:hypothetical protein
VDKVAAATSLAPLIKMNTVERAQVFVQEEAKAKREAVVAAKLEEEKDYDLAQVE